MRESASDCRLPSALGLAIALAMAVSGCGNPESLLTASPPTAVATQSASSRANVTASVEIVPADVAELSFVVSGPVKQVIASEGQAVRLGDPLIALDAPELSYASTAAQEAVKSAEADESIQGQGRRKWDGTKFVWLSGPPEQRQLTHAHALQAQAQLDVAEAELAQATLTSPMDGTVVSINASQGELVQPGEVVLVIANLNHLRAETTDLSEREIARVQRGQHATMQLKAFSTPLNGMVTAVMPISGRSPDGDIVYKVTIELQEQPAQLLWGMTGDVEINTAG